MRRQYLKQRGARWWFQIGVPKDCRHAYTGSTIDINLRTTDQRAAQAQALQLAGKYREEFARLRGSETSHPSDIYEAARVRTQKHIERLGREVADPEERLERTSLVYDLALEGALWRAGVVDVSELMPGDLSPDVEAELAAIKSVVDGVATTPDAFRTPFSRLASDYLKDRQRPGASTRLKEQTVAQMEAVYRLFRDHTKDAPLSVCSRRVASQFFDKLKRLDANWGRSRLTKSRTLDQLLALSDRPDAKAMADRTLFRYMIALDQVWEWARGRDEVEGDSPFSGQVKKGTNATDANAPWSDQAVIAYFKAHPDQSKPGKPDPFYWLPRIALLSGMRLDEICSLTRADVVLGDGVPCFDIKAAKSSAGVRAVPVHRELRPFLKVAPKSGLLFPDLVRGGKDKKLSAQIGKRMGRRFDKVGGSTFHAFRKNVAGTFERHRVLETEAAQILGHGKKGITYGIYSPHGIPIKLRQKLVNLLSLPTGA